MVGLVLGGVCLYYVCVMFVVVVVWWCDEGWVVCGGCLFIGVVLEYVVNVGVDVDCCVW